MNLNSVPLMLEGEIASIRKLSPAAIRLSFTRETDLEMEVLLRQYGEQIIEDKKLEPLKMEHTKGHFKRGVKFVFCTHCAETIIGIYP